MNNMNTENLLEKLEEARKKYKPKKAKVVFVAEAPPDSLDRFFYYEDVKKADYLFLGIIDVLYPGLKEAYMEFERHTKLKENILEQFKKDGYYLLDLYELPISMNYENDSKAIDKLSKKLEKICDKKTPVILIKANVYDVAYYPLKSKFNVINKRISFPSNGNQIKFKESFTEAINETK
jgi:hypothetical protein